MNRKRIVYTLIVSLFIAQFFLKDAEAGLEGGVIIGSWHHDREKDYNENNEGLVLQYNFGDFRIGGMSFVNSYGDPATALFYGGNFYESPKLDLGLNLNFVSGYHNMNDFTPIPTMTATVKPWTSRWAPAVALQGIPGVVYGFGLSWRLE